MSNDNRTAFIERLKSRLDEIDEKIGELEEQAQDVSSKASEEYHERLGELRSRRKDLANKLEAVRSASELQWSKLKRDAEYTWDAVQNSFKYFKSHFK